MATGTVTLFDKIVAKEIPATVIYEDDTCLAFKDINPQAPVHFLVIPKHRGVLSQLQYATPNEHALLGHLLWAAGHVAGLQGLHHGGYRVVLNDGKAAGQTVFHLHLHVLGGRELTWPPG